MWKVRGKNIRIHLRGDCIIYFKNRNVWIETKTGLNCLKVGEVTPAIFSRESSNTLKINNFYVA